MEANGNKRCSFSERLEAPEGSLRSKHRLDLRVEDCATGLSYGTSSEGLRRRRFHPRMRLDEVHQWTKKVTWAANRSGFSATGFRRTGAS